MASSSRNLPNLKICVQKSDDEGSDDAINADLPMSSDEEVSKEPEKSESVEFSVAIKDLQDDFQRKKSLPGFEPFSGVSGPKIYENKSGDFITGFNLSSKEYEEKKELRAKRFGLSCDNKQKGFTDEDLKELYASLGITENSISKGERGIRPEAIHFRGTDNMSTQDVFNYFKEFSPGSIEWIDDASCNVVWMDPMTAARAMIQLSVAIPKNEAKREKLKPRKDDDAESKDTENMETDETLTEKGKDEETGESTVTPPTVTVASKSETMETEFDDDLDLLCDDEKENKASKEDAANKVTEDADIVQVTEKQTSMTFTDDIKKKVPEDLEEGELSDDEDDVTMDTTAATTDGDKPKTIDLDKLRPPPGIWRAAIPNSKATNPFMRFATKADKKLHGAERKSKYYQKYGNPNYGGAKGVISNSRKRKLRDTQYREEVSEAQYVIEQQKKKALEGNKTSWLYDVEKELHDDARLIDMADPDYKKPESDDDWFDEPNRQSPPHRHALPRFESPPRKLEQQQKKQSPLFTKSGRQQLRMQQGKYSSGSSSDSSSEDEDLKLHRRLNNLTNTDEEDASSDIPQPPVKKKMMMMRMHADDEEKQIKKRIKKAQKEKQPETKKTLFDRLGAVPSLSSDRIEVGRTLSSDRVDVGRTISSNQIEIRHTLPPDRRDRSLSPDRFEVGRTLFSHSNGEGTLLERAGIKSGSTSGAFGDARGRISQRKQDRIELQNIKICATNIPSPSEHSSSSSSSDSDSDSDSDNNRTAKTRSHSSSGNRDLRSKLSTRFTDKDSSPAPTKKYLPLRIEVTQSDSD